VTRQNLQRCRHSPINAIARVFPAKVSKQGIAIRTADNKKPLAERQGPGVENTSSMDAASIRVQFRYMVLFIESFHLLGQCKDIADSILKVFATNCTNFHQF
jgi:hypothetical protein